MQSMVPIELCENKNYLVGLTGQKGHHWKDGNKRGNITRDKLKKRAYVLNKDILKNTYVVEEEVLLPKKRETRLFSQRKRLFLN